MEMIKRFGTKEKKEKFVLMILAGVLILVILMPTSASGGKKAGRTASETEKPEIAKEVSAITQEGYVQILETRLAKMISYVEGAGSVKVMITLKSSEEQVVEKDVPSRRSSSMENGEDTGRTENEYEMEETTVYLTDSEGKQTPYVIKRLEPAVEGVVVAASGGGDETVCRNITEVIQALFEIEPHKIKVVKMKTIK